MTETMPVPGTFVWRELMTDDVERARAFYSSLFGWTWTGESMGPEGTYWLASRGGDMVAGMMRKPGGAPIPTSWSSYVLVEDVDATVRRCTGAGGRVLRAATDVPGVGRFAVLSDPWGAALLPFKPIPPDTDAGPRTGPGTFCWETLVTPDPAASVAFYGKVLGLGTGRTPNGEGTVLTAGSTPVADVQPGRPGAPSVWATYVAVESADDARDHAVRLGGAIVVPRIDVPAVGTIALIADPTGASLGLFQPG